MRQIGLITHRQLRDVGFGKATIADYARQGRLHRTHQGVYSLVPATLMSLAAHRMSAVLAAGEHAALSHLHCLHHVGVIKRRPAGPIDVTVPSRGGRARKNVAIHRSTTFRPDRDVMVRNGIPTTTIARALVDSAGLLTLHELDQALTQAARLRLLDLEELREQLDRARHRPATDKLRRVIATWDAADALTESELEAIFLKLLKEAGLPGPEQQVWLDLHDGEPRIRADFFYRRLRLIIETDGARFHDPEQDKRRDQRAAAAGYLTVRFTYRQIIGEPDRVRRTIARAYAQALQRDRLHTAA